MCNYNSDPYLHEWLRREKAVLSDESVVYVSGPKIKNPKKTIKKMDRCGIEQYNEPDI